MRDLSGDACRRKQAVERRLADVISRYGYRPLDVPVLESTELFLRKSGGDLASQMYSFADPGSNAVSLRPEFTSAIMRHYLETIADTGQHPVVRWQYAGPVFRYDLGHPPPADNSGQFTQVGRRTGRFQQHPGRRRAALAGRRRAGSVGDCRLSPAAGRLGRAGQRA